MFSCCDLSHSYHHNIAILSHQTHNLHLLIHYVHTAPLNLPQHNHQRHPHPIRLVAVRTYARIVAGGSSILGLVSVIVQ